MTPATGEILETYTFTAGFLNDVAVTEDAVYVTDSLIQQLIVIPLPDDGSVPDPADAFTPAAHRRPRVHRRVQRERHRRVRRLADPRPVEHRAPVPGRPDDRRHGDDRPRRRQRQLRRRPGARRLDAVRRPQPARRDPRDPARSTTCCRARSSTRSSPTASTSRRPPRSSPVACGSSTPGSARRPQPDTAYWLTGTRADAACPAGGRPYRYHGEGRGTRPSPYPLAHDGRLGVLELQVDQPHARHPLLPAAGSARKRSRSSPSTRRTSASPRPRRSGRSVATSPVGAVSRSRPGSSSSSSPRWACGCWSRACAAWTSCGMPSSRPSSPATRRRLTRCSPSSSVSPARPRCGSCCCSSPCSRSACG